MESHIRQQIEHTVEQLVASLKQTAAEIESQLDQQLQQIQQQIQTELNTKFQQLTSLAESLQQQQLQQQQQLIETQAAELSKGLAILTPAASEAVAQLSEYQEAIPTALFDPFIRLRSDLQQAAMPYIDSSNCYSAQIQQELATTIEQFECQYAHSLACCQLQIQLQINRVLEIPQQYQQQLQGQLKFLQSFASSQQLEPQLNATINAFMNRCTPESARITRIIAQYRASLPQTVNGWVEQQQKQLSEQAIAQSEQIEALANNSQARTTDWHDLYHQSRSQLEQQLDQGIEQLQAQEQKLLVTFQLQQQRWQSHPQQQTANCIAEMEELATEYRIKSLQPPTTVELQPLLETIESYPPSQLEQLQTACVQWYPRIEAALYNWQQRLTTLCQSE